MRKQYFPFFVLLLFLADRISKQAVLRFLPEGHSIPVIDGIFHLTRVDNAGAAFGLFRGALPFLVAVTVVSVIFLFFFLSASREGVSSPQYWGWTLVMGGALGNLYDRLTYHYVIDFLDVRVWPVFNVADSFVCVGVFLVFLSAFRK